MLLVMNTDSFHRQQIASQTSSKNWGVIIRAYIGMLLHQSDCSGKVNCVVRPHKYRPAYKFYGAKTNAIYIPVAEIYPMYDRRIPGM